VDELIELGADGRLVMLQLEELIGGVEEDRRLVAKDYYQSSDDFELAGVMHLLAHLEDEELLDLNLVAGVLQLDPEIGIDGVQLHGAIGFTAEYDIQLYLKRSKWARPMFGDSDYHYERVAQIGQY